jgi:hypothetical protein
MVHHHRCVCVRKLVHCVFSIWGNPNREVRRTLRDILVEVYPYSLWFLPWNNDRFLPHGLQFTLKKEVTDPSETLINNCWNTRYDIPEDIKIVLFLTTEISCCFPHCTTVHYFCCHVPAFRFDQITSGNTACEPPLERCPLTGLNKLPLPIFGLSSYRQSALINDNCLSHSEAENKIVWKRRRYIFNKRKIISWNV